MELPNMREHFKHWLIASRQAPQQPLKHFMQPLQCPAPHHNTCTFKFAKRQLQPRRSDIQTATGTLMARL